MKYIGYILVEAAHILCLLFTC